MSDNKNYVLGLICGISLIFLNSSIVNNTINLIFTLFDPTNVNSISLFLIKICSFTVTGLSFIGILVTIYYIVLILRNLIKKN